MRIDSKHTPPFGGAGSSYIKQVEVNIRKFGNLQDTSNRNLVKSLTASGQQQQGTPLGEDKTTNTGEFHPKADNTDGVVVESGHYYSSVLEVPPETIKDRPPDKAP